MLLLPCWIVTELCSVPVGGWGSAYLPTSTVSVQCLDTTRLVQHVWLNLGSRTGMGQ